MGDPYFFIYNADPVYSGLFLLARSALSLRSIFSVREEKCIFVCLYKRVVFEELIVGIFFLLLS